MDKNVIFAVAGSGKTQKIINELVEDKRFLLLTYTDNNERNLRSRIIRKFGYFPPNISLQSYFSFLYSFCYKPFLSMQLGTRGLCWKAPPDWTGRIAHTNLKHFIAPNRLVYHNRLAKLIEKLEILPDVIRRIEKYFDQVMIDEVQDFAGNDFNFILKLGSSKLRILMVGDFFQHTYDTSRDGNVNRTLHDDFTKYLARLQKAKFVVDEKSLRNSHRCSPTICCYIEQNLGISIESHRRDAVQVIFVADVHEALRIYKCNNTVKLFYQDSQKYDCYSRNWGASKGEDHYVDVCVVLNDSTYKLYEKGRLIELNPQTKNKLYVALTRARGNVFIVPEKIYKPYKKIAPRM